MYGEMPRFVGTLLSRLFGALGLYLVGYMAVIAAAIFLGIWAYRDAKNRGLNMPGLIGVAVAMVPYFIGLIVYVCTRPKDSAGVVCANCRETSLTSAKFCGSCGASFIGEDSKAEPLQTKNTKHMLIGFFISLGVCIILFAAAIALYFTGIFGIMGDAMRSNDFSRFQTSTSSSFEEFEDGEFNIQVYPSTRDSMRRGYSFEFSPDNYSRGGMQSCPNDCPNLEVRPTQPKQALPEPVLPEPTLPEQMLPPVSLPDIDLIMPY